MKPSPQFEAADRELRDTLAAEIEAARPAMEDFIKSMLDFAAELKASAASAQDGDA